jgi:hypothetical protein
MNIKTTLALMVLLGAGALLWWFGGPKLPSALNLSTQPVAASDAGTREFLESLKADQITRIEVKRGGETSFELLRKPDGAWGMAGNWPVRKAEVEELVARLVSLRSRFRPQPLDEQTPAKTFRLDPNGEKAEDRPLLAVKLTVGGEDHTIWFGEEQSGSLENRFARDTYVRLDKKPEALRLPPGIVAALDKPRDYYQQRRLFEGERVAKEGGDSEKVERLKAHSVRVSEKKTDGPRFTLERRDSEWELAEPVRDRLDSAPRDALLSAVPDIWAEQFAPPNAGDIPSLLGLFRPQTSAPLAATDAFFATQGGLLVRSGLLEPERTISVKYDNGDTVTLEIGSVSSRRIKLVPAPPPPGMPPGMGQQMRPVTQEYRYARLQDNDQIFQIQADKLKDVFVALDTLRDPRVARFNTSDAQTVEIERGGSVVSLRKEKDQWKIVKPFAADADNTKVTDLLNKLSDLQARDKDILDKEDPKKYGLDKPEAVVTIGVEEEVKKGDAKEKKKRSLTVRVGKHDAEKKKLYVMSSGSPRIDIVDDSLEPLVNRSALAYRGKRLFDFNAADAAKIDIDNQGKKLTLEQDKGAWRLTSPAKAAVDTQKIDRLLADLGGLEAADFVSQSPAKDELESQYGLGKPALTVHIAFADKNKPARELRVGKPRDKGGYFAIATDTGPVFAITDELHKELARDSLAYLPQNLWQITPEDVAALRIHKAGQAEYTLTRSGEAWNIGGPFTAKASAETVQRTLAELSSPRIESYKAHEAKNLAEYGLDKPALTLTIQAKQPGESGHTLLIGKPVPAAAGEASRLHYAKRGNDPAIFTVADTLVRAADRSVLDLLDTRLLNVASRVVERVRVESGDKSLTLEKKNNVWRVTESPAGAFDADRDAASSLSLLWLDLRAQGYAAYGKNVDWAKYGLDKPATRLTIGAGKMTHTIEMGKPVEGEAGARYVRVDKGEGAAVLSIETARLLERTYLDYVDHDLLKFDGDAVVSLQRHMGPNVLEIVKSGETWEVAKPVKEKADTPSLRQLFEQLGNLHAERIAAYPAKDLQTFGLDAPSAIATIAVKGEGKPKEHILKLGKTTGDRGDRFALVDDGKTVAVLSGELCEQLTGAPLTFRDRSIARFADADRLSLERGPRKATFAKAELAWKLIEPLQADAEQDPLDAFVGNLRRLRADKLVAEKADAEQLKKYGLDRPVAEWRAQANGKDVLHLLIGNEEPKGSRRYAKLAKGDLIFLLDPRLSREVLDEYRTRAVWTPPLDAVQIESLNYRYKSAPFTLEKLGSAWQVVGKPDAKINAAAVEDTLAALAGLKLSRYAADKGANLALFGLDKPELILEASTRTGKRVLHIGNFAGDTKARYARVPEGDKNDVFVLDEETCGRLLRDIAAFGRPPARPLTQPAAR